MSKSRWGGFRIGKRVFSDWETRKAPSAGSAEAPASVQDFDYTTAQGVWNLRSTTQFSKKSDLISYMVFGEAISTVNSTSLFVPFPSGIEAGDFLIIDGYMGANVTASTPSGWNDQFNGAYRPLFFKIADGSETGSVTIQKNTTTTNARAQMYVVRVPSAYSPSIKGVTDGYASSSTYTPTGFQNNGYDLNFTGFGVSSNNASAVTGFTPLISGSGWSSWYKLDHTSSVSYTSSGDVNIRHIVVNIN